MHSTFQVYCFITVLFKTGPALGMFGRTGLQILGAAILDPGNKLRITCQFERLWCLYYGANTDINAATRCALRSYSAAKLDCDRGSTPDPAGGTYRRVPYPNFWVAQIASSTSSPLFSVYFPLPFLLLPRSPSSL